MLGKVHCYHASEVSHSFLLLLVICFYIVSEFIYGPKNWSKAWNFL